jgi:dipeptidase D
MAPGSMAPTAGSPLAGLQPPPVWGFFEQLCAIPRPSKHEGQVLAWLREFAATRGLEHEQDSTGNLVIRRPGSGGGQDAPIVVVQVVDVCAVCVSERYT